MASSSSSNPSRTSHDTRKIGAVPVPNEVHRLWQECHAEHMVAKKSHFAALVKRKTISVLQWRRYLVDREYVLRVVEERAQQHVVSGRDCCCQAHLPLRRDDTCDMNEGRNACQKRVWCWGEDGQKGEVEDGSAAGERKERSESSCRCSLAVVQCWNSLERGKKASLMKEQLSLGHISPSQPAEFFSRSFLRDTDTHLHNEKYTKLVLEIVCFVLYGEIMFGGGVVSKTVERCVRTSPIWQKEYSHLASLSAEAVWTPREIGSRKEGLGRRGEHATSRTVMIRSRAAPLPVSPTATITATTIDLHLPACARPSSVESTTSHTCSTTSHSSAPLPLKQREEPPCFHSLSSFVEYLKPYSTALWDFGYPSLRIHTIEKYFAALGVSLQKLSDEEWGQVIAVARKYILLLHDMDMLADYEVYTG